MASRSKSLSVRITALVLLAAFLGAQALTWVVPRKLGAVESVAIAAGEALEFCPHHPEGCPKECTCPKIRSEADSKDEGAMRQATLERCAGKAKSAVPEALGTGLPSDAACIAFHPRSAPLKAAVADSPADAFSEPPVKVPIC